MSDDKPPREAFKVRIGDYLTEHELEGLGISADWFLYLSPTIAPAMATCFTQFNTYDLLACPCCGGSATIIGTHPTNEFSAICRDCGLETAHKMTPNDAASDWNKRHAPDQEGAALRAEQAVGEEQIARELLAEYFAETQRPWTASLVRQGAKFEMDSADTIRAIRRALDTARQSNTAKHVYWGAGEPECPKDIKADNGELHTRRCKVCGLDNPKATHCNPDAEEDAFVIDKLARLLAEIAIALKGPEPPMTRWSYHDLPKMVRELVAARQSEGMVLVPREPTAAMVDVAARVVCEAANENPGDIGFFAMDVICETQRKIWAAMLAAAPGGEGEG